MAIRIVSRFRREDYETIRRLVPDAKWADSFDEWSKASEQDIAKLKARGHTAVEVIVDPKEYVAFCHSAGHDHNFATLEAFAVYAAWKNREGGA
jgi:hypothetical protein